MSTANLPLSVQYALGGISPAGTTPAPGMPMSTDLDPFADPDPAIDMEGMSAAADAAAADAAVANLLADDEEGGPQQVKAQWKQAHPSARKWAAKRKKSGADHTGRTPKPLRIMFGFVIVGIAAYFAFVFLPDRKPLSQDEMEVLSHQAGVDLEAWRYPSNLYAGALGAVGLMGLVGLMVVFRGATYRPRVRMKCGRCKAEVLAEPAGFGFRCTGGHSAGTSVGKVSLLIMFLLAAASLGALTVIASLIGPT